MALFDKINSRYTKSMEHGGSYERDAAIGGYDRKELRGLSKQAKRGTLTQRERARYKYLKDERGGRRKRGLLAGLGGAGATLAALAAAGKLGGGAGGAGGAGLMDMIKGRLSEGKARAGELGEKGEGSMEGLSSLGAPKNISEEKELMKSLDNGVEAEARRNMISNSSRDFMTGRTPRPSEQTTSEGPVRAKSQFAPRPTEGGLSDAELLRQTRGGGITAENYIDLANEKKDEKAAEEDRLWDLIRNAPEDLFEEDMPILGVPTRDLVDTSQLSSENPSRFQAPSFGREVPLGDMLTQTELDAEDALPGRVGERPTQSPGPKVANLLKALEKAPRKKVDSIFKLLNSMGLDGGEAQYNPDEVAAPDRLMPRYGTRGNQTKIPPQLEALEQLKKLLGNRYR